MAFLFELVVRVAFIREVPVVDVSEIGSFPTDVAGFVSPDIVAWIEWQGSGFERLDAALHICLISKRPSAGYLAVVVGFESEAITVTVALYRGIVIVAQY